MTARPLTAFNFEVNLSREGGDGGALCEAAFSECDGLEMNMEAKTIREGGDNGRQIHLAGPVTYGKLSLKRGMTTTIDLWSWFDEVQSNRSLRASGEVLMLSSDQTSGSEGPRPVLRIVLTGCLPTKLKVPSLNAKDGLLAIEEMQLAYETLTLTEPDG